MKKQKKYPVKIFAVLSSGLLPFLAGAQTSTSGWSASNYAGYGLPTGSIYSIILAIMQWALGIFGFIAIIGFVISGIMYLTAAGDDDRQEKAKNQMMWSIVGVIVGLAGYVIIYAVTQMLGGSNTQF